jgi:GNAT superfamily N-acetyltransferase
MFDLPYDLTELPPSVGEYMALRIAAGLSAKTEEAARLGLARTIHGVTVRLGAEAVAMGRVIGDGGCFFDLVDIAVLPAHQRRGLGRRIVAALMAYVHAHAPKSAYVTLLADGPARKLYEEFGFVATAPSSIGMGLKIT